MQFFSAFLLHFFPKVLKLNVCIKVFFAETTFLFVTDNPTWVKENLNNTGFDTFLVANYHEKLAVNPIGFDVALLSSTDYNMWLYGTFAFWSSYMNDKPVSRNLVKIAKKITNCISEKLPNMLWFSCKSTKFQ